MKYVYHRGEKWVIYKYVRGCTRCFGTFENWRIAKKVRDELIVNNWNTLDGIVSDNHNIYRRGDKWVVQKLINGEYYYHGVYDDLSVARSERDFCDMCNWDLEEMCCI